MDNVMDFVKFIEQRDCEAFTERLTNATEGYADFMQVGVVENHQIFKMVINPDGKRTVVFVAGLHGDEPGGPEGVLSFLEEKPYIPKTKKVVIIPLVNPTGWNANTRRNKDNKDINRQFFKKELSGEAKMVVDALKDEDITFFHSLHEDPDQDKFYLYWTDHKPLADEIMELAKKYFKICDGQKTMYGDKIVDGMIGPPHNKSGCIEDLVGEYGIPYFTTETPGRMPLSRRAKFTKEVMKLVIHSI